MDKLKGVGFATPNPFPMFPNPPGLLRLEPHSEGLRERIWWGASSNATAIWAAENGMHLQSSTLKLDESGKPFHVQQAEQIRVYKEAWKKAGHQREPRVSVSRSIFALMNDQTDISSDGKLTEWIKLVISRKINAPFSAEVMPENQISSSGSWRRMRPFKRQIRYF
ncbi:LLM class flavin-dependent oxidoreductase [Chitinophaga pinensis]|uniref:LLM class flavin-dependent oxidoreductase n=1 Tax=Chitinophaga pinensis TaxID=79329 RepID=UPI0021BDEF65|nr:LLM class flavin-dependent oxidoreductase [Chitinophaga pinensis]